MADEIIVYLDDYKYGGDGKYDTLYLDFRTSSDFEKFLIAVNIKERTLGSYLEIHDYQSPKRLVRGAYYALNVHMLKELKPEPHYESLLLSQTYYFSQYSGRNDVGFRLLQKHAPLDVTDLSAPFHNPFEGFEKLGRDENIEFRVNNVSQANWNEVLENSVVKYVYDIGAPINASVAEVQRYIDNYATTYAEARPILVLSHWDKDHYHCLLKMRDAEINNFSKFVCVDNKKSNMAKSLYDRIERILGRDRVFNITIPVRTPNTNYPQMQHIFSDDVIALYVGEKSRNTNYSGIILYAQGGDGNVVFSGDSIPIQANQVLTSRMSYWGKPQCNHYLVVPHHGGDFTNKSYKIYHIMQNIHPIEAIISVDANNNNYGHPRREILNWLRSIANWHIMRTDNHGTLIRAL